MFEGIMDYGIEMSEVKIHTEKMQKAYPNYLIVSDVIYLTLSSRVDPTKLKPNCAYAYHDNLYITDGCGNLAYVDCEMTYTENAAEIKRKHPEYKRTGGRHASRAHMDAGHLGVQLGQHPSISMEQDAVMNRYGSWRTFELNWLRLVKEGHQVNVKAVFADDGPDIAFSPFWCVCEAIDGTEGDAYALLNEKDQY